MSIIGVSGRIGSGKDTVGQIIQYLTSNNLPNQVKSFQPNIAYATWSDWRIKKFADKLKDCVCVILSCTREQLEDTEFKNKELGEEWDKYIIFHRDIYGNYSNYFSSLKEIEEFREEKSKDGSCTIVGGIKKEFLTPRKMMQLLGTECGRQILHPDIWVNATMNGYPNDGELYSGNSGVEYNVNWIVTDCRFPNEADAIKKRNGVVIKIERGDKKENEHESETALDNYQEFDYLIDNNGSIEQLIERTREILIDLKII